MIPQGKAVTIENARNSLSEIARRHLAFAVLSVIAMCIFYKSLAALVVYSLGHESASHIFLIPVITLYLLYTERKRIFQFADLSLISGGVVILIGIGFYWLANPQWESAEGNDGLVATTLSFVVIWIGAFALCYGSRVARAAAFPLLFLLLMVPLPEAVLDKTIYLLQLGSTEIACLLFKVCQVPVFRRGSFFLCQAFRLKSQKNAAGFGRAWLCSSLAFWPGICFSARAGK